MILPDFRLYLVTDRHQTGGRPLTEVVRQSLDAGLKAVQLREKDLSTAALYRLAHDLRRLTSDYEARLIINDRLDIALAMDADGVHIGVSSLPVAIVRSIIGFDKIIGYSAHAIEEARAAQNDGADFVTVGPVYPTPSKMVYGEPCGVKKMAEVAAVLKIPVIGLGGISGINISEALSADIQGVAVISAIMTASEPYAATASLLNKIEEYAKRS